MAPADLSAASVVVWSPPRVIVRGVTDLEMSVALRLAITCPHYSCVPKAASTAYLVRFLELLDCNGIVKEGQWSISTVYHCRPVVEGVLSFFGQSHDPS